MSPVLSPGALAAACCIAAARAWAESATLVAASLITFRSPLCCASTYSACADTKLRMGGVSDWSHLASSLTTVVLDVEPEPRLLPEDEQAAVTNKMDMAARAAIRRMAHQVRGHGQWRNRGMTP